MSQIYNYAGFMVFASGTTPQQTELRISIPFPVGKIVFHPPYTQILTADSKNESYFVQSDLNPHGVGVVGAFNGVSTAYTSTYQPVTVKFAEPKQIDGNHRFMIRGFAEAGGGAAVPITAKVFMMMEFHSAK